MGQIESPRGIEPLPVLQGYLTYRLPRKGLNKRIQQGVVKINKCSNQLSYSPTGKTGLEPVTTRLIVDVILTGICIQNEKAQQVSYKTRFIVVRMM